jgi:two-component system, NtrC family, response regulator AtoC
MAMIQMPMVASPFVAAVVTIVEEELRLAARVDARVLISAENRDLREMCARFIHRSGSRSPRSFVPLRNTRVERRSFDLARGGTLFIDDIGELDASGQAQLYSWLDGDVASSCDRRRSSVRIIAGANGQLDDQRRSGRFSEALYYRLNLIHIDLLRYRPLTDHKSGQPPVAMTPRH